MLIDLSAPSRPDPDRVRAWLAGQRVFISSAMADTIAERRAVAAVVEEVGAQRAWFEEFGRDADAEEAYVAEVDAATIYIGILNEQYGRLNPPDGFAATESEYMRAREGGKRVNVFVAANAPGREGHLSRFIDRVRFFVTTENYADANDLARRVRRRLEQLAAEALSPWVRLGELVFRADEIIESDRTITIRARVSDGIADRLDALREGYRRDRLRFVSRRRVADGEVASVGRTTCVTGGEEMTIELTNAEAPRGEMMRPGTGGYSAADLTELGMRTLFLGEPLPDRLGMLDFMADTGIDLDDLRQAFDVANEIAEPITRLVIADGLIGSGRAARIVALSLGPRERDVRRVEIEWEDAHVYTNVASQRRALGGEWRRPV